jgi:ribosomal-protein-alanine N-acetyltransferase
MHEADISQVTEIDQEAFPTMWPPPNYERELKTKLAHYLVASVASAKTVEDSRVATLQEQRPPSLAARVRQFFHDSDAGELPRHEPDYLVGFAGFWMMANEAHITNIAVRRDYYRQGIGELLLIAMIDLAQELNARLLTLEVRVSNTSAQNLYQKYGFDQVDLRKSYYTDNKEDALVMAVEDITAPPFQTRLKRLKEAHSRRRGAALYHPIPSQP